MGEMTKKERLLKTLKREPVDRVPISTYEIAGYCMDSWYNKQPSYAKLMEFIRDKTECLYETGYNCPNLALDKIKTEEKWEEGNLRFRRITLHTPKGNLTMLCRDQEDLLTTWTTEHLLKNIDDLDKWLSIPYEPGAVSSDRIDKAREELGDNGIIVVGIGDPLLVIAELFKFEDFLVNWAMHREKILYAMDVIFERQYDELKRMLELGAGPSFRLIGPEYATPPYAGPDDFRELVVKYDARLIELVHQYGGFVRLHCHGKVGKVLPMFVEMQADGVDPLEAPPSGDIELEEVKKLYGDDIVLFGNIQLRDLEFVAPKEMDEIVKKAMNAAKKDGGYVLMPTASPINASLKPETEANYYAFIEAGLKYGAY